jgi:diguanylate cyclase (GGDEF)-like protein
VTRGRDKGAPNVPDFFVDQDSGVFVEEAFRHLLSREAMRATRYQDFFSVCLVKPDAPPEQSDPIAEVVGRKISQFLRSTDMVGRLGEGIAVLLLHTEGPDAGRVAERLREHIERVAFPGEGGEPRQVTLSVGAVSFPRDGYNDAVLLSRARANLAEAARGGGNRVVHASENRD